jgi:serine/threonine protein kinase
MSLIRMHMVESSTPKGRLVPKQSAADGFVFDHYFLDKRLAHGGMAEVFLGRDMDVESGEERCVVKCILPDLAGDPQFLAMFLNEAQLAAQMDHPNIVKVLDFGEHDGLLYMAMEYVDGLDCWRFARRVYPFGEDHAAVCALIITQILDALAYAHAMRDVNGRLLRVVHRDLSPSNIYLSKSGQSKLGDFGIARIESTRYRQITYIPRGKFGYVSPEQIEGGKVDSRADIFAMGIVFAELLIGKKLFKGPSQLSVLLEIRDGRFYTLEQNEDRIEPGLLHILRKALSLSPENRHLSASAFRDAIAHYMGRRLDCASSLAALVAATAGSDILNSGYSEGAESPLSQSPPISEPIHTDKLRTSLIPTNPNRVTPSIWESDENDGDENATPITKDFDAEREQLYAVQFEDGRTVSSMSFALVMELIYRDEIGPNSAVSVNNGPFLPVDRYPELFRHVPVYTPTLDVKDVKSPERRGVFAVEGPAEVVLSLTLAEETGLLVCKKDRDRKEVYFKQGTPVYASSNDTRELLGEYLVSKGIIERSELDMALAVLPKFDGHMGDTLIALGMISAMELFRAIGDQIRTRFAELLIWGHGTYEFYRGITCRQNAPEIPINPYMFLADTLFSHAAGLDHGAVMDLTKEGIVSPTSKAAGLLRLISLPEDVEYPLRTLERPTSVSTLAEEYDEVSCAAALYVGIETGIWTLEGCPIPWRTAI